MVDIVLGSQYGDEGKGKLTDHLTESFDVCARAQGGHNAGHSVKTGDKSAYKLHLLPSGIVNPKVDNLIGSGCVFNVDAFFEELDQLETQGIPRVHERIHVSSRCHLNLTLHAAVDGLSEQELGSNSIGTTKKGIGPAYSCKASRDGLRVDDIYHESFERRLRLLANGYSKRYGALLKYSVEDEIQSFDSIKKKLRPYIVDAVDYMRVARENKKSMLVEASQALMLDLDFGSYPFVTSTSCSLQGCMQGLGISPFEVRNVIGVVKCYMTRVGSGPFLTEQHGDVGSKLQDIGGEIGVSTGRRRRCGWLDLVILKYSAAINHYTSINLTKLDVLDTFPMIRVATAYITPGGDRLTTFPADLGLDYTVEYRDFEGWQQSTSGIRTWSELPLKAQKYIEFIETSMGVKAAYIGTGQDREDMIIRQ
ncbi:Adenylosuccinate synthase [Lecanora helva]